MTRRRDILLGCLCAFGSEAVFGVATLVAVLAGAVSLGETFTAAQALAAVLILAGVWIANGGRGE